MSKNLGRNKLRDSNRPTFDERKSTTFEDIERCVVCGRTSSKLSNEDKRNNLTQADVELDDCRYCGETKCGFCFDLGLCLPINN